MLEESFLKTNFMGRDGFRWWVGQIPPEGKDYDLQQNGGGWGNRIKVRILGYHPYSVVELPNKDLPWATILMGTTDGSGAQNRATSVSIAPGDTVFGFFLDGDNGQVPVIMGVFGRTSQVPTEEFISPFVPFTGNTEKVKNDGGIVANSQSNEQNSLSQVSPIATDKKTADKVGEATGQNENTETALRSASPNIGQKVLAASKESANAVRRIKTEVGNFVSKVQSITANVKDAVGNARQFVMREIGSMTASIQKGAMKLVGDMTKNLTKKLMPTLNSGLQVLYDVTYNTILAATGVPAAADIAGTMAQAALITPVKELSDAIPCVANNVINGIGDIIKGVLTNVADNVFNFVECIGDQVVGALMNHIIGGVESFLKPFMGGLDKILQGFSIGNFLGSTGSAILSLADKLGCEEVAPEFDMGSDEWVIGKGSSDKTGVPVDEILAVANQAKELATAPLQAIQDIAGDVGSLGLFDFANPSVSAPGFESALGNCYAGPPELGGCGGTKVKLFGGGVKGAGGVANAILQIAEGGRGLTGSVIGVDLVNGGGGYTFPPFVEIVDECGEGFGATARAKIDYDPDSPTYQQITDIYIVTDGQGYTPSSDIEDYIPDDEKGPNILDGGSGYDSDDIITDNYGNQYEINTDGDGSIIKINRVPVERDGELILEFPSIIDALEYNIISKTGSGAVLRPRLRVRPEALQGVVKQVIDCISKDDDFVGYVNGKKYYGPFHIHMGRRMTGVSHTGSGQYIYNNPAESLGSASASVSTTTQISQVSTSTSTPTATPSPTPTPAPTPPATSGGGGSAPTPSPTPTPPPSPPTPPPSSGGGYGGGY